MFYRQFDQKEELSNYLRGEKFEPLLKILLDLLISVKLILSNLMLQIIKKTLEPSENWGPKNKEIKAKWIEFKASQEEEDCCSYL